ncbi:hypothetical protein KIS1582_2517 [Cytobacillus firmus]|uniref:Uncharacterized protein n=1 Tax=Cytobacillus firmus TaxID=1399 RepID=A0A800MWB3_CYTFI|nr:hypothetical protein KIS1582_2517 [Cytobacillus firmus]
MAKNPAGALQILSDKFIAAEDISSSSHKQYFLIYHKFAYCTYVF